MCLLTQCIVAVVQCLHQYIHKLGKNTYKITLVKSTYLSKPSPLDTSLSAVECTSNNSVGLA